MGPKRQPPRPTQKLGGESLERMARVDRTVLRIGAWELLRDRDAPRAVVVDQAVELGKAYGSSDSGAFVNGVLDRVAEDLGRR